MAEEGGIHPDVRHLANTPATLTRLDCHFDMVRVGVGVPESVAESLALHIEGLGPGEAVFTSPNGKELRSSNFARRILHPAIDRCRVEDSDFPSIVFHDLRRTAVSLTISGGSNPKVVQQIAGHKSAVTTMDVYAHVYDDDLQSSAQAVEGLLNLVSLSSEEVRA